MSLATRRDMGTTVPLFLTRDITTIDEDTTLSSPTKAILVDVKVMVALFLTEWAILPTRQGMVDMEHQGPHQYCGEHRQEYPECGNNAPGT